MVTDIDGAAFKALGDLIALIANPKACEARFQTLQRETDACAAAQSRLSAERAALEAEKAAFAKECAGLDALKAELKAAKADVARLGQELAEANTAKFMARNPRPQGKLVPAGSAGSTMTREYFPDARPSDAHYS